MDYAFLLKKLYAIRWRSYIYLLLLIASLSIMYKEAFYLKGIIFLIFFEIFINRPYNFLIKQCKNLHILFYSSLILDIFVETLGIWSMGGARVIPAVFIYIPTIFFVSAHIPKKKGIIFIILINIFYSLLILFEEAQISPPLFISPFKTNLSQEAVWVYWITIMGLFYILWILGSSLTEELSNKTLLLEKTNQQLLEKSKHLEELLQEKDKDREIIFNLLEDTLNSRKILQEKTQELEKAKRSLEDLSKELEKRVNERTKELQELLKVSTTYSYILDLKQASLEILQILERNISFIFWALLLFERRPPWMIFASSITSKDVNEKIKKKILKEIDAFGNIQKQDLLYFELSMEEKKPIPFVSEEDYTIIDFPLIIKGRIDGYFILGIEKDKKISASHREFLRTLTNLFSISLERSRFLLEREKILLNFVFRELNTGLVILDRDKNIFFANKALKNFLGIEKEIDFSTLNTTLINSIGFDIEKFISKGETSYVSKITLHNQEFNFLFKKIISSLGKFEGYLLIIEKV